MNYGSKITELRGQIIEPENLEIKLNPNAVLDT